MLDDPIKSLEGLVISNIDITGDGEEMLITTICGKQFMFKHYQDCCESVYIEDEGELHLLNNKKLVSVDSDAECGQDEDYESWTRTRFIFKTDTDTVITSWFGSSNGYYSEDVSFFEIK